MKNLIKKVFLFFEKILFEQEVERNTHCIHCGKRLKGSQRRFCNDKCNNTYWRNKYSNKRKNSFIKNLISAERRKNKKNE